MWTFTSVFPTTTSMLLEIGPGRGDFLFWLAQNNPNEHVVGIEIKQKRHEKLLRRKEALGITNIQIHCGDARHLLPQHFCDESVDAVFVLFSDPWPKRRHSKNRVFQKGFIQELNRILKPDGVVYIAHDDPNYVTWIKTCFLEQVTHFVYQDQGVEFLTFYAEKWKREGRTLKSFSYRKINTLLSDEILAMPCLLPSSSALD